MANEITITASISGYKPSVMLQAVSMAIANINYSMAGTHWIENAVAIDHVTPTAIPLGSIANCGFAAFFNTDTVNYCTIRNGSAGADVGQIPPQGYAIMPLLPACVPYSLAHTATVILQYLIFEQ
jgi:hypothetical protein